MSSETLDTEKEKSTKRIGFWHHVPLPETHSDLLLLLLHLSCHLMQPQLIASSGGGSVDLQWLAGHGWEVKDRRTNDDDNEDGWCGSIIVQGVRDMVA